jgi:hypothetical protein
MTYEITVEARNASVSINWVKLERAETWIGRLIWLAPLVTFSAILFMHLAWSRLYWGVMLFSLPFLSALCLAVIHSIFVELKNHCCRLDTNVEALVAELEGLEMPEERR